MVSSRRSTLGQRRGDQHQVVKAHGLHGAGAGAHVAGMAGIDQDETGLHGHAGAVKGTVKMQSTGGRVKSSALIVAARIAGPRYFLFLAPRNHATSRVAHTCTIYVVQSAPHAQRGHQGRPRRRRHHQPRGPGRGGCAHLAKADQRLRDRGGPRQREGHHRDPAHPPWPRHPGRGIRQPARRQGFGVCLDHRPAGRHHQLHPRFSGLLREHCLAVRGKIEQAVIYDPSRNDLFTSTKGRGAT